MARDQMNGYHRGALNPNAKLTLAQVRAVRRRWHPYHRKNGTRPLAKEYCVSPTQIRDIVWGRRWGDC